MWWMDCLMRSEAQIWLPWGGTGELRSGVIIYFCCHQFHPPFLDSKFVLGYVPGMYCKPSLTVCIYSLSTYSTSTSTTVVPYSVPVLYTVERITAVIFSIIFKYAGHKNPKIWKTQISCWDPDIWQFSRGIYLYATLIPTLTGTDAVSLILILLTNDLPKTVWCSTGTRTRGVSTSDWSI